MAEVIKNKVSRIDTEKLENTILKVLPKADAKGSVLTRSGATQILGPETKMVWGNLGGPAVVSEGEEKPLSSVTIAEKDIFKAKFVQMFSYTHEGSKNPTSKEVIADLTKQAVQSFVPGFDIAILKGTTPHTGLTNTELAAAAIVPNAVKNVVGEDYETSLNETFRAVGSSKTRLLLSEEAFFNLGDVKSASGLYVYRDISPDQEFNYRWVRTITDEVVAMTGWDSNVKFYDDTLAVAGDYANNVIRRLDSVRVDTDRSATIGGRSLFTHNEEAVLIEAEFSFAIKDFSKFAVLVKDPATGE